MGREEGRERGKKGRRERGREISLELEKKGAVSLELATKPLGGGSPWLRISFTWGA